MIEDLTGDLKILVGFGLTPNQAKIYLTMLQSKAHTIKAISKLSNIPLESIYRAMPGLEEKNIVEKLLTAPTTYKALPIQEAIALLKTSYEQNRDELYKEAEELSKKFSTKKTKDKEFYEEDPETIMLLGFNAYTRKVGQALDSAKYSFKGIIHSRAFRKGMFGAGELFEGLVKRGIKCRHLVYQSDDSRLIQLGDSRLTNNPFWVRKFISPIPVELIIVDQKEFMISLTPQEMGKEYRGIWTTNSSLLALADNYFDLLWKFTTQNEELKELIQQ